MDNQDGTITDYATTPIIMWQKTDDGLSRKYAEAQNYCQNLSLGGNNDWRLPTIEELKAIVYCSNGAPSLLAEPGEHPSYCNDGYSDVFLKPTIDVVFQKSTSCYRSSSNTGCDSDPTRRRLVFLLGWQLKGVRKSG